jgi:spore coat polysaccharide biosynthesis protein SpsF
MDDMVKDTYIILQARMNSERLPGKVMKEIAGIPMIGILLNRLKKTDLPIILATSTNKENDILVRYAESFGVTIFRGSENNVLERFYIAAKQARACTIIRLTSDNPLLDGEFVRKNLNIYFENYIERTYLSTGLSKTFPLGMSVEIFSFKLLEEAYKNAKCLGELEHVTPYFYQNTQGDIHIIKPRREIAKYHYRLTVDTDDDFIFHKKLIEEYGCNNLSMDEIISIIDNHPELLEINKKSVQKKWDE